MNSKALIDRIVDQADDFLDGVTSREQARAAISEMITMEDARVPPDKRTEIVNGVMHLLEGEGFFDASRAGTSSDDADEFEEE